MSSNVSPLPSPNSNLSPPYPQHSLTPPPTLPHQARPTPPPISRAVGAVNMCISGLGAVALGLLSIAGLCATTLIDAPIRRLLLWGAVALYQVGVPLYAPTIPTMLLQCVPPYQRGAVMGLDGGVNTIARVLSPLILGSIYSIRGPSACYVAASAMVALSAALAVFRRFYVRRWTARDD